MTEPASIADKPVTYSLLETCVVHIMYLYLV